MYISQLSLKNFRAFKEETNIKFNDGINVLIGQNNSGKTSIIKALDLLFNSGSNKKLSIHDFSKNTTIEDLKKDPPAITISAKLTESENEEDYSDDIVTVSTWLTKIEKPYEALITYKYFLPDKELENYKKTLFEFNSQDINDYWYEIEYNFLRKYKYKIYVGDPVNKNTIDSKTIDKFDFQFLSAIRDVERDMFTGRNSLLKEVIDFFIDYDIKTDNDITAEKRKQKIEERKISFSRKTKSLIGDLQERMKKGKKHMLKYAEETGASFDNLKPSFDGRILDTELYSALKLIVESETGLKIPVNQNGLGYNNLIYISLLLAKMQKDASGDYMGSNAKVYSILAIEEPEAHLHPNMQYKFLKFLNENRQNEVRQIFITTHSPNITAAVDLDDIIVLNKKNNMINISYPGKVFKDTKEDKESKSYVQRFLDVTKADIFFAKSIIFVEGITEQMLIPEFAKLLGKDLVDSQISVTNIGGRYFKDFLKLFDTEKSEYAIKKKIVCITDLDPVKKKKAKNSRWKSCYPFGLNNDEEHYEYKCCSNNIVDCYPSDDKNPYIRVYSQEKNKGCTFEYDLILENPTVEKLLTKSVSNKSELKEIMDGLKNSEDIQNILSKINNGKFKEQVCEEIENCEWDNDDKIKHILAARFLASINKGPVAQELSHMVSDNFQQKNEDQFELNIPNYIKEAIIWICQEQ